MEKLDQNENRIYQGEPFHPYRYDEIEHDLHIRITDRKGKEYRHIDIICREKCTYTNDRRTRYGKQYPIEQKRSEYGKQYPAEYKAVVLEGSDGLLKCCTQLPVEYYHDDREDYILPWRHKYPAYHPPYLEIVNDIVGLKRKIIQYI